MNEFSAAEQHVAPGFTYPNGTQATLFSSDNAQTVLRHFQWMQAWAIDGVGVQRFGTELNDKSRLRVLTYTLDAAVKTGRALFVEYDMTGMQESSIVNDLTEDWKNLVDNLKITSNSQYLHQGGLPVVGVYGFFIDRYSTNTANAILDIFQRDGPYRAFVAGSGEWYWRTDQKLTPEWTRVFYRMNSWQPWNAGNVAGQFASTGYWNADQLDFQAHNVIYVPEIYPGMSTDNRDGLPPGKGRIPRNRGAFLWNQFAVATKIRAKTVFVGMFDELDEGTQILKVTNSPPTQASFIDYEGLPSDAYLCWTGLGTKMFKGLIPYNETVPNCSALTQPTVPEPLHPAQGSIVVNSFDFTWKPALALFGGGEISHYEIAIDNVILRTPGPWSTVVGVKLSVNDTHVWCVRAVNSLGNAGGWSTLQSFTVKDRNKV